MKNIKVTVGLITLCLLFIANVQGGWRQLINPPQIGAEPGSALCAGIVMNEGDTLPKRCVWFLQNGTVVDSFSRYETGGGTWTRLSLPFGPIGPGGALAYASDPSAASVKGWVFAFKGNNSREFWVFFPENSTWERAPDVECEPVIDGGALCYGGVQEINDTLRYLLYAFTGQEHQDDRGNWYGHFWRYYFKDDAPLDGIWERRADIPRRMQGRHPALTWLPMNNPTTYPMGLVVAMKNNENNKGLFYLYDPQRNQWEVSWYIPIPMTTDTATLGNGACMTSHCRDSVMFLLGNTPNLDRAYGFYAVENHRVYYPNDITPQSVRGGAAITALLHLDRIGNLTYGKVAFAEFGTHEQPSYNPGFYMWEDSLNQEGGQGVSTRLSPRVKVAVHPNRTFHMFSVKCASGPVKLSIMDVTGRKLTSLSAECWNGNVDITYNHPIIQSGVYLWKVSTPSGDANGKMVIAK